jgi:hypothetical protein
MSESPKIGEELLKVFKFSGASSIFNLCKDKWVAMTKLDKMFSIYAVEKRPNVVPCFLLARCFMSRIFRLLAANENNWRHGMKCTHGPHFYLGISQNVSTTLPKKSSVLLVLFPTGLQSPLGAG